MQYFKFAFVRNPWDRLVSAWAWNNGVPNHAVSPAFKKVYKSSFNNFLFMLEKKDMRVVSPVVRPQSYLIDVDNVDFIGRFENLDNDSMVVWERLGFKGEKILHYQKSKHSHYSSYYDEETKEIVEKLYHDDILNFEYEFMEEEDGKA